METRLHCITSYNLEEDELMCITHQKKLCVVCGAEINEDETKCFICKGFVYGQQSN